MATEVKSITLIKLAQNLTEYIANHPEDMNKMVYFDYLHINGKISKTSDGNYLELE